MSRCQKFVNDYICAFDHNRIALDKKWEQLIWDNKEVLKNAIDEDYYAGFREIKPFKYKTIWSNQMYDEDDVEDFIYDTQKKARDFLGMDAIDDRASTKAKDFLSRLTDECRKFLWENTKSKQGD